MNPFKFQTLNDPRVTAELSKLNDFHGRQFVLGMDALEVVRFPEIVRQAIKSKIEVATDPSEIVRLQAQLNSIAIGGDDTARSRGEALARQLVAELRDKIGPVILAAKQVIAEFKSEVAAAEVEFFARFGLERRPTAVSALVDSVVSELDRLEYGLNPEPGQPVPRGSSSSFSWHLRWFRMQE